MHTDFIEYTDWVIPISDVYTLILKPFYKLYTYCKTHPLGNTQVHIC